VRTFGSPLLDKTNRSMYAFSQHYAFNLIMAGRAPPSSAIFFQGVVRDSFGEVRTVPEAARANPKAFAWHLWQNVRHAPLSCVGLLSPQTALPDLQWALFVTQSVLGPGKGHGRSYYWAAVVALLGFLAYCATGWRSTFAPANQARQPRACLGFAGLLLLAVPAGISSLLVCPRVHYLLPAGTVAMALLAIGLDRRLSGSRVAELPSTFALLLAFALVVPNRAEGWCLQTWLLGRQRPPQIRPIARTSGQIRSLGARRPLVVLDQVYGVAFYSGVARERLLFDNIAPQTSFADFLSEQNVDIVVLSPIRECHPRLSRDASFRSLAAGDDPRYRLVPVAGTDVWLAVRRDLLPPGP
jgi:hypothetical protein